MNSDLRRRYEKVYTQEPVARIGEDFHKYRRNVLLEKIYQKGEGKKLLDLGAGSGAVSMFFKKRGYCPTAVEWTESAAIKIEEAGIPVLRYDIEDTPFPIEDGTFDEVFWGDNIEHLFDPETTAREIYRVLASGGRLVLSTPNHGWVINRLYYAAIGVPRKTEGHDAEIWNWQHIRYFNKREIERFLKKCGFGDIRVYGTDQRRMFEYLSGYWPSLFSSLLVVTARKR